MCLVKYSVRVNWILNILRWASHKLIQTFIFFTPRKYPVCIVKTKRLMLLREVISCCCCNDAELIISLCSKMRSFLRLPQMVLMLTTELYTIKWMAWTWFLFSWMAVFLIHLSTEWSVKMLSPPSSLEVENASRSSKVMCTNSLCISLY